MRGWSRQELAARECDDRAASDRRDKDSHQGNDRLGIAGRSGRLGVSDPQHGVGGRRGVGEREGPEGRCEREPYGKRDEAQLGQRREYRVAAQRAGNKVDAPAVQCKPRDPRHDRRCQLDGQHGREGRGQRGAEEQAVQHRGAEQQPADDADSEQCLGDSVPVNCGSHVGTDKPAGHGRQVVAGMGGVLVERAGDPLATQPSPESERGRQGDGHHDAAGGQGNRGERDAKEQRRDQGRGNERTEHRVADVWEQLADALGKVRGEHDQPDGGGQDEDRVWHG
jgi:hypothetical protein